MRIFSVLFYFWFIMTVFFSCINSEDYARVKKDLADLQYSHQEIIYDSIYKKIPEYDKIVAAILQTKTELNEDILADPLLADFYTNSKITAFAFGLYSADLAYVRHFGRVQLCINYLDAVRILSEKLAVNTREFNNLVPSIEAALDEKQIIFQITDSLLSYGAKWFSQAELHSLSVLFIAGFWTETLYLGIDGKNIESDEVKNHLKSHFEILGIINDLFLIVDDSGIISDFKGKFREIEDKGYLNVELYKDISEIRSTILL